jgi:hypothetical protein
MTTEIRLVVTGYCPPDPPIPPPIETYCRRQPRGPCEHEGMWTSGARAGVAICFDCGGEWAPLETDWERRAREIALRLPLEGR